MAISTNPKDVITISLGIVLSAVFIQIRAPFIWDLETVKGEVFQIQYHLDKRKKEEFMLIWIDKNIRDSFIVTYPSKARNINTIIKPADDIKIWHENMEIKQLLLNNKKVIDYDWFSWLIAAWGGVGFLFLHGQFRDIKKKSLNVKTYAELFDYYIGGRKLIMKRTGKPYDPKTDFYGD